MSDPKHIRVDMPKAPPTEVLAQTFGNDLPSLDNSEGGVIPEGSTYSEAEVKRAVEKSGMDNVVEPVKENDETHEIDDTTGKAKPDSEVKEVVTQEDEDPFKGELEETPVVEDGLPAFLKPPVKAGKEEATKVEQEVNYADFSESEVVHMKNMNKQARKYVAGLIKSNKELSSAKTNSFMQHPQGYILSPEYQGLQQEYSSAGTQYNHWRQQLLNCKAGKNVQDLTQDAEGKFVVSGDYKPTDDIEELCRTNMMQCQTAQKGVQNKMTEFPTQYSTMVNRDLGTIRGEITKQCPWVSNPKLLDYTVEVKYKDGNVKQESIRGIRDNFLGMFPPYMRNNNVALEVAANLMVANVLNEAKVRHLEGGKKVAETKVKEVARAEPSGSKGKQTPKTKINGVSEFNMGGAGIEIPGM